MLLSPSIRNRRLSDKPVPVDFMTQKSSFWTADTEREMVFSGNVNKKLLMSTAAQWDKAPASILRTEVGDYTVHSILSISL